MVWLVAQLMLTIMPTHAHSQNIDMQPIAISHVSEAPDATVGSQHKHDNQLEVEHTQNQDGFTACCEFTCQIVAIATDGIGITPVTCSVPDSAGLPTIVTWQPALISPPPNFIA